jgi:hypothetical protein
MYASYRLWHYPGRRHSKVTPLDNVGSSPPQSSPVSQQSPRLTAFEPSTLTRTRSIPDSVAHPNSFLLPLLLSLSPSHPLLFFSSNLLPAMSEPIRNKKADIPVAPYVFSLSILPPPIVWAIPLTSISLIAPLRTLRRTMLPSRPTLRSQVSRASKKVRPLPP